MSRSIRYNWSFIHFVCTHFLFSILTSDTLSYTRFRLNLNRAGQEPICLVMPSISSETQERNGVRHSMNGSTIFAQELNLNLRGVETITFLSRKQGSPLRARTMGTHALVCVLNAQGEELLQLRIENLYGQFWYSSSCRLERVVCGVRCEHLRPRRHWSIHHLRRSLERWLERNF